MATKGATTRRRRAVNKLGFVPQVEHKPHGPIPDDSQPPNLLERHEPQQQDHVQRRIPAAHSAIVTFLLDSEEDEMIRVRIFPRYAIVFLAALTFYSRYLMVTGFEGLGMIHPDENFQAVEVANSEVYGYGILPPKNLKVTANSRTLAYSDIYAVLFRAKEFLGWESNPFVLARSCHSAVAALLPVVVYKFVRTIFGQCRDIAFSSAVLVAFSKHLIIFGTHPSSSSLASPLVFLISTIVLRLARADPKDFAAGKHQTRKGGLQAVVLLVCGVLVGYVAHNNVNILLTVLLITCAFLRPTIDGHYSHDPATPLLPSYKWLTNTLALLAGALVGLILAFSSNTVHANNWFEVPFQTMKNIMTSQSTDKSERTSFLAFLQSFIGGSQVHLVILGAATAVCVIYILYCARLTDIFDTWVSGSGEDDNDSVLFSSATKITIISTLLLIFHYIRDDNSLCQMHDVLVLILVSGASSAYILYRGLYTYILKIVEPGKTTRNIVKLILYAELLLYMFESRMTFPTAMNKGIESWTYQGLWESAYVNLCLKYVSEQQDVTGVVIDYPILMTGGFALLRHRVPVWAKHDSEFREWRRLKSMDSDQSLQKFTSLSDVNDIVSLLNTQLLLKKVIEAEEYNYVIIAGKRKFPKRGFRKVFNASDVCVFKRSKSQSEKQYLLKMASEIPLGTNATVLAYEGARLINFQLWKEAFLRLKTTTELQPSLTSAWRLFMFTLTKIDSTSIDKLKYDISTFTSRCLELHSSECIVTGTSLLPTIDLAAELEKVSATYNFKGL